MRVSTLKLGFNMAFEREKTEEHYLEVLRTKYRVIPAEKYPDVMIKMFLDQALSKYVGNKNPKKRMVDRVSKYIQDKVRSHYGRYASLTDFEIKRGSVSFHTNFHLIFKVKDVQHNLGYLYGSNLKGPCEGILFTEHSLERFEERSIPVILDSLRSKLKDGRGSEPTILEIISYIISVNPPMEYGRFQDIYYMNILTGILVLEKIEDVYIAKTYLSPEMLNTPVTWYHLLDCIDPYDLTANDFFTTPSEEIEEPSFLGVKMFKDFTKVMEKINEEGIKKLKKIMSESGGKRDYTQDIEDLTENFKKFKQYTFHPEMVNKKAFFDECRELEYRFKDGPIIYFMDAMGIMRNAMRP